MKLEKYSSAHRYALEYLLSTRVLKLGFEIPKLGFVVYDERGDVLIPVCAGFLREIEGGSYLFDSLISNSNLNSEQRNEGMSMLWEAIVNATDKPIIGLTVDKQTLSRALAHGFEQQPHAVLTLSR